MKRLITSIFIFLGLAVLVSCGSEKYGDSNSVFQSDDYWVVKELDEALKTDTFFVGPTATYGDSEKNNHNLDFTNDKEKSYFSGAVLMEKKLYDDNTRFFAPYYSQAMLEVYEMEENLQKQYLDIAYTSIRDAFTYYLDNYNNGNAIILAGFSQGADMCLRLLEEFFTNNKLSSKLVCCYAIGWKVTDEYLNKSEYLKFAEGASDTGVIVSFNSEAEDVTSSFVAKENEHLYCINPLNWKTDNTVAQKEENLGACFYSSRGVLKSFTYNLCGCYVDTTRGVLKVLDIVASDYPNKLKFSKDGVYHVYDYQFFYENIKENVDKRIISYYTK